MDKIQERARLSNAKHKITGCLVFNPTNNKYLQLLEGSVDNVEQLYDNIVRDPLHENVVLLHRGSIKRRSLDVWQYKTIIPGKKEVSYLQDFRTNGLNNAGSKILIKYLDSLVDTSDMA